MWGTRGCVKSQVAIGYLRNSGKDPLVKQLDPTGPTASRWKPIRPYMKYVYEYMGESFQD